MILILTLASFTLQSCLRSVNKTSLTVEELANEGTHDYETYCEVSDFADDCSCEGIDYIRPTIKFYKDQVKIGSNQVYSKISENTYEIFLSFDSQDKKVTITFNRDGYSEVTESFYDKDEYPDCVYYKEATILK